MKASGRATKEARLTAARAERDRIVGDWSKSAAEWSAAERKVREIEEEP